MHALPPKRRSELWSRLIPSAGHGQLVLPRCRDCETVQYPLREICGNCLGDNLEWGPVPAGGKLVSWTRLHASVEPFFREHLPWPVGSVKLDCGPVVIAHLAVETPVPGMPVSVLPFLDGNGAPVLVIVPEGDGDISGPVSALVSDTVRRGQGE